MDNIAFEASSVLLGILKTKFQNDFSNIKDVKLYWHNLNYLLISKINCIVLKRKYESIDLNDFYDLGLIPSSLMSFYKENFDLVCECIDEISSQIYNVGYAIDLFREQLLSIELNIRKNEVFLNYGKVLKDATGSYYTPYEFAKAIVTKTFSKPDIKSIIINNADKLKIADISCGGGDFLCAAQEYLYENYGINHEDSSKYFWGIDIDPIILQITICKLLVKSKRVDWKKIISHFCVGNPLILTKAEKTFDKKNELFALNRYYSDEMGLDLFNNSFSNFDIILGNPPWEKIRFEERKFFKSFAPNVSKLSKKDERAKEIELLKSTWIDLYQWSLEVSNDYKKINSKQYAHPLIKESVSGELNTYSLFTELCYNLLKTNGISTLVVKNTLVTAPMHKNLWKYLLSNGAVDSLHFYDNKKRMFHIDTRERFAVVSLSRTKKETFLFASGLELANDILDCNEIIVCANDIKKINPFTNMIPNVTKNDDFEFLIKVHERLPLFKDVYSDCHFGRLIHLTAHSEYISKKSGEEYLPIYEGKFIEQYDARFSTFADMPDNAKYASKASARKNLEINETKPIPESRYFIQKQFWDRFIDQYSEKFSLCWRSLTSPTNARTSIAMILPTFPTCQSIQMLQTKNDSDLILLLGLFNSLPFDYFVRLKMPGIDLTQSVIKQIPVPSVTRYTQHAVFNGRNETLMTHILSSVYHLIKNEEMLQTLSQSIEHLIYKIDDNIPNDHIRKTLDKIFICAYQIDENTYKKMVKSFPKY